LSSAAFIALSVSAILARSLAGVTTTAGAAVCEEE
jgi:hypothetical protein